MKDQLLYHNYMPIVDSDKPLSIDRLVQANGNWTVSYVYNNFGKNVLYLLPNYQVDNNERMINEHVLDLTSDCDADTNYLVHQFSIDNPLTPFIVMRDSMVDAVVEMDARLHRYTSFDKFCCDAEEFDHWRQVVCIITLDPYTSISSGNQYDVDELCGIAQFHHWKDVYKLMETGQVYLPRDYER